MLWLFHNGLHYLRTLYIVWSLVRRRVTRRITRLQTMCNVSKYRKCSKTVAVRLRFGCGYFFNLLMFSTVASEMVVQLCVLSPAWLSIFIDSIQAEARRFNFETHVTACLRDYHFEENIQNLLTQHIWHVIFGYWNSLMVPLGVIQNCITDLQMKQIGKSICVNNSCCFHLSKKIDYWRISNVSERKTVQYWIEVNWKNNRDRNATAPHRFRVFCDI